MLATIAAAAPPPASAFGRLPAVQQAAIAPSGERIAILGETRGARTVSIATLDQPGLPALDLGDIEALDIRWAGDAYVLATTAFWSSPLDGGRSVYRLERTLAINTKAEAVSRLLMSDDLSGQLLEQPIVGVVDGPPARVMMIGLGVAMGPTGFADMHMKRETGSTVLNLLRVAPETGKGVVTETGEYATESWEVDRDGDARLRLGTNSITHTFRVDGRAKGTKLWRQLWSSQDREARRALYGYADQDDAVYVLEDTDQGMQPYRVALKDGARTPVGRPSTGATPSLVWDRHRGAVIGVTVADDLPSTEWLDPDFASLHATLSKVFKGRVVELTDWSRDRSRLILRASSSDEPAGWYMFDRARKELSPLGLEYPELAGQTFGETRFFRYKARDGLEIPAYLTLPRGAGLRPPLIVLPHGGPASRDTYDFDYLTQFLASRGYAVLRPQYRGSFGFGRAFEEAGEGQWGLKMQTDLLDGVAAVGALGVADASRVCIVGASFGGYAAMAGLAFHPEAYRCAASIEGISDLGLMIVEDSRLYGRESAAVEGLRRSIADLKTEAVLAQSPRRNVSGVKGPLLLIHAERDTIVPIEQSRLMAEAMQQAGKAVDLVTLPDDNHYLAKPANRVRMLEALEAFLAKNLPVVP